MHATAWKRKHTTAAGGTARSDSGVAATQHEGAGVRPVLSGQRYGGLTSSPVTTPTSTGLGNLHAAQYVASCMPASRAWVHTHRGGWRERRQSVRQPRHPPWLPRTRLTLAPCPSAVTASDATLSIRNMRLGPPGGRGQLCRHSRAIEKQIHVWRRHGCGNVTRSVPRPCAWLTGTPSTARGPSRAPPPSRCCGCRPAVGGGGDTGVGLLAHP